ncbi:MAG TPA: serine/threonine-protein kinase, partial [Gemmataceae bacterium]|nr:serine/threonine-protein kinase [Gemmataceae bacterium]
MSQPHADRNLLFGILAVQMDFITRDQLLAGMNAWVLDKGKPLGDILRAQGALAADDYTLIDKVVAKHLAKHGNDAARSLAAVSTAGGVREALARVPDPAVNASLGHVRPGADIYATRAATPSAAGAASGTRFRVLRPHARGGLGEVHVARDEELNRDVALKEIQGHFADNPESRSRFMLEAEITGALEHPGIVPVYGLGTYPDGRPFYAMRFIRGDSLQESINRFHKAESPTRDPGERALALRGLLRRFVDVCNAVTYAHSRGILHRDIKPGNVMLGQYGETLVVDWGLAKPLGDSSPDMPASVEGPVKPASLAGSTPTYAGMAVGTPQYMSPEQAAGRIDELGPASDVYSLGATLYCLLAGKPPLEGVDVGEVFNRVLRGDVPPAREAKPTVPSALNAICAKAMALLPENRYSTAKSLAEDVERWLADEPTTAWREPWTIRARRWAARHRTGVTAAAASVLVAVVCLGVATVLLTAANRRERAARQEAQENYKLARRAVDRYHTEVSEEVLLNEPGMEGLRRRLLEAAREFYDQFARTRTDDPEVKAELGRAVSRLAQITADVESPAKGIELLRQALGVFDERLAGRPDDVDLVADKAACLRHLGRLLRDADQLVAAADSYRGALALWGQLQQARPEDERYKAEEARTRLGLGNVEQVLRRLGRARDEYERALAVREPLVDRHPDRADYQRDLATTRHNLAMVQTFTGPADQAKENLDRALAAQEKLATAAPHVTLYQADVARTHANLGTYFARARETERAAAEFQTAADLWARLADKHPAVLRFRAAQAKALLLVCKVWRDAKQPEAA